MDGKPRNVVATGAGDGKLMVEGGMGEHEDPTELMLRCHVGSGVMAGCRSGRL